MPSFVCWYIRHKTFLCSEGTIFPLYCHSVCASLSFYQLAIWKNIFPVVAGTRQKGGWLSSGAATFMVLALIWHRGNRDLTALPQKSDPSDARKRDLLLRLSQMYGHTNTKSKRAVGRSARMQLRPVSADLLDESLRTEDDWGEREWQVEARVGVGGIRKTKTQFKRWDMSRKASSHSA